MSCKVPPELLCLYKWTRRVISATIVTMYVVDLIHGSDFESISKTSDPRTVLQPSSPHFLPKRVPTTSKSHMGIERDALTRCKTVLVLVIQSYSFCAGNRVKILSVCWTIPTDRSSALGPFCSIAVPGTYSCEEGKQKKEGSHVTGDNPRRQALIMY